MKGLNILLLFICWIIAGHITAGNPITKHYRVKNSSFCLQVGKSPPRDDVMWTFNETVIVFNKEVEPNVTDRVVYNWKDKSLCVNNLTETDSGIYEVLLRDTHRKSETHQLIVQDAVPRPVIRMSVFSSNLSDAFCNITVNCSVWDEWVWSVCDEDGCINSQRSFSGFNITISAENRAVVCSGKNHVSTSVSERLELKCFTKSSRKQDEAPQHLALLAIIIIVVVAAVCILLCALTVLVAKRHFSRRNHPQASPSLAQIIQSQPAEAESEPVPRLSTSSSEAEASYENVDTTRPSQTSSPTVCPREELGSRQSQPVDTVYSFLQAPKGTDSVGENDRSKDTKGHMRIQEASASQTVTLNETQQPPQIDTVYSVLQKSENVKSQHHQKVKKGNSETKEMSIK